MSEPTQPRGRGDAASDLVTREYHMHVIAGLVAERDRYRQALEGIASRPPVERNPDGEDQAAYSMQLIAREALGDA